MPKKTLDDIAKARAKLDQDLVAYDNDRKKQDTRKNKIMMEYKTIRSGLDEGLKEIADLKQQLKDAVATWHKMFDKIGKLKDDLATVEKVTRASLPKARDFEEPADDLSKELASCAGELKDLKAEAEALKGIKRAVNRIIADYNNLLDECGGMPKDPEAPTLQVA